VTDIGTDTNRGYDKDSVAASGSQVHIRSRLQDTWNSGGVHPFTGGPSGLRIQEVPHVNKDYTPIIVFLLFYMEVIQLLVAETSKYCINIQIHSTVTADAHNFQM
jgi:hypothetical protein